MSDEHIYQRIKSLFTDIDKPATNPENNMTANPNEPHTEMSDEEARVHDSQPENALPIMSDEPALQPTQEVEPSADHKQEKLMNKPGPSSTLNTIQSFRKRRQSRGPMMFYIFAAVLVVAGIIVLVLWLTGPSKPLDAIFATETPTPTVTFTPTSTSTSTPTPTETLTPTITNTPTPSAPFQYTVQEGDYLATIVEKFTLGPDGIPLIFLLNPYDEATGTGIDPTTAILYPGQVIWIPNPGMPLPTATSIPVDLPRGTKLTYIVQAGDTLGGIAALFNSTIDAIIKENKIEDANALFVGQQLIIPANIVTPTATRPPTSTPASVTPAPPVLFPTLTPTGTKAP